MLSYVLVAVTVISVVSSAPTVSNPVSLIVVDVEVLPLIDHITVLGAKPVDTTLATNCWEAPFATESCARMRSSARRRR